MRAAALPIALSAACAGLSGCAAFASMFTADDLPVIPRGNTVIVRPTFVGADTLPTAQRYCATLGLGAQERTITPTSASYDCR